MTREELGHPGHFIGGRKCQFMRHTHTRNHCISTVGEYLPAGSQAFQEIGDGRLYETMVFLLDTESVCPGGGLEVDSAGYNDAPSANAGHERMVRKWSRLLGGR